MASAPCTVVETESARFPEMQSLAQVRSWGREVDAQRLVETRMPSCQPVSPSAPEAAFKLLTCPAGLLTDKKNVFSNVAAGQVALCIDNSKLHASGVA